MRSGAQRPWVSSSGVPRVGRLTGVRLLVRPGCAASCGVPCVTPAFGSGVCRWSVCRVWLDSSGDEGDHAASVEVVRASGIFGLKGCGCVSPGLDARCVCSSVVARRWVPMAGKSSGFWRRAAFGSCVRCRGGFGLFGAVRCGGALRGVSVWIPVACLVREVSFHTRRVLVRSGAFRLVRCARFGGRPRHRSTMRPGRCVPLFESHKWRPCETERASPRRSKPS